jgi:Phosphodiester glycosidase
MLGLRRLVPLALAAAVAASLPAATGAASATTPRYTIRSQVVAPGLTLLRIVDHLGPRHIFVLRVKLKTALTLDVGLASHRLLGFERTSSMVARYGAIAGVNGDFAYWPGRPMHAFMEDGTLRYSSRAPGQNFSVSHDEARRFMHHPAVAASVVIPSLGFTSKVSSVNDGRRGGNSIVETSPWYRDTGPVNACSARLAVAGPPTWGPQRLSVVRPYTVLDVTCGADPVALRGRIAISARRRTQDAVLLKGLAPGTPLSLRAGVGWPDVLDSIGGVPDLVKGGKIVLPPCDGHFCQLQPRTGVGWTADGTILLVVVDGRQDGWSVGIGLMDFARLFRRLGATAAMNLDGGGSSTMVVKGTVVNRPCDDTGERAITSSILVLPGRDPGETNLGGAASVVRPGTAPWPAVAWRARTAAAAAAAAAAAVDPGSTGGLLDAMARGSLGGDPGSLDRTELRELRRYRSSRG